MLKEPTGFSHIRNLSIKRSTEVSSRLRASGAFSMKMCYSREDGAYRSHLGRLHKVSQGERSLNKNRLCYFKKICWVSNFQNEL